MKPFPFYALILSLFSSFYSYSQIDSTLLEKIKAHDTVYVFIEHGLFKSEQYNYTFGKVALNAREAKMQPVQSLFPKEIDTLRDSILIDLNKQFSPIGTTKFSYIGSGSRDELIEKYAAQKLDMIIVFRFIGTYDYDYLKPCGRSIEYNSESDFISFRKYSTSIICEIYQYNDKQKFERIESTIYAARSLPYKEVGYTNNVNVHLKEFHPMELKYQTQRGAYICTEHLIEKLTKDQEREDKKRTKKNK